MSDFTLCSLNEPVWQEGVTPAIMVPIKGKKSPPIPKISHISRGIPQSYGDAEAIGYYKKSGYYAQLESGVLYDSGFTKTNYSSKYNTGFRSMIRCEGNIAVAIYMANPSWYPKRGQVRIWDTRFRGYARPLYLDRRYYIALTDANGRWYDKVYLPDDVSDMTTEEIINYVENSGAYWNVISSSPTGDVDFTTYNGRRCSASYYMWKNNLAQIRELKSPLLVRYGEHFSHGNLVFRQKLLETSIYQAYMQAVEALPKDEMNWLASILDLIEVIIACVTGNVGTLIDNVPKMAANVWLSYRYSYQTTIHDIETMEDLSARVKELEQRMKILRNPTLTTFGQSTTDGAVVRVSLTYSVSSVLEMNNFLDNTKRLLAYHAWDLIPFSFIVDWFYSVGDLLHDNSLRSYAMKLQPAAAWCSVSYTCKDSDDTNVKRYFRCRLVSVPGRPDSYSYRTGPNATTLSVKHSFDSLAIVIGML